MGFVDNEHIVHTVADFLQS